MLTNGNYCICGPLYGSQALHCGCKKYGWIYTEHTIKHFPVKKIALNKVKSVAHSALWTKWKCPKGRIRFLGVGTADGTSLNENHPQPQPLQPLFKKISKVQPTAPLCLCWLLTTRISLFLVFFSFYSRSFLWIRSLIHLPQILSACCNSACAPYIDFLLISFTYSLTACHHNSITVTAASPRQAVPGKRGWLNTTTFLLNRHSTEAALPQGALEWEVKNKLQRLRRKRRAATSHWGPEILLQEI